jgi:ABC-type polysaccharide/polyol phosphate export permease
MGLGTPSDANAKIIRTVGFIIRMLATITMILGVANLFGVLNISWYIVFVPVWVPILCLVSVVLGARTLEVVNKFVNKD